MLTFQVCERHPLTIHPTVNLEAGPTNRTKLSLPRILFTLLPHCVLEVFSSKDWSQSPTPLISDPLGIICFCSPGSLTPMESAH